MIQWGIIGAGTIAHRFADSLAQLDDTNLLAVSNRTKEKAVQFKKHHHATYAYDDYQAVLDNPAVDMVYIALPHAYHYEWIKKAILARKGILCEKPVVLTSAELEDILNLLREQPVFFMEAMKSRFVPAYVQIRDLIHRGVIGELRQIDTSLRRHMPRESTTYHYDSIQGGCLLDMGIYNISLITDFTPSIPTISSVQFGLTEENIETFVEATFSSETLSLSIEVGFDQFKEAKAIFTGTKGTLILPDFHRPTSYLLSLPNQEIQEVHCPYEIDDFDAEIRHAMACFKEGLFESPKMTWSDSLTCAKIIDQLKEQIAAKKTS